MNQQLSIAELQLYGVIAAKGKLRKDKGRPHITVRTKDPDVFFLTGYTLNLKKVPNKDVNGFYDFLIYDEELISNIENSELELSNKSASENKVMGVSLVLNRHFWYGVIIASRRHIRFDKENNCFNFSFNSDNLRNKFKVFLGSNRIAHKEVNNHVSVKLNSAKKLNNILKIALK